MTFREKLKQFQPYEVIASELIMKYKNTEIVGFCDDNRYDFITGDGFKFEVKTEPSSMRTGNYFIEYFAYGKPSGITTTQADYYIFCNTVHYHMITVKELKELVKQHGRPMTTADRLTRGHLVKCSIINGVSILLN